jgi:hypothetical protein
MRGCADARSRQYFSYFAFFSALDPGDGTARRSVFAISAMWLALLLLA